MSRLSFAALTAAAILLPAICAAQVPANLDPHMDKRLVTGSCSACHAGHGASRSPMLPRTLNAVCLDCHDTNSRNAQMVSEGRLASDAQPQLLGTAFAQPSTHPLTDSAMSRHEQGAVTCTSCHTPHRGQAPGAARGAGPDGTRKVSPRDPNRFEYELCGECHGIGDLPAQKSLNLTDTENLLSANNRSYHPVEAPSNERAPSVPPGLTGRFVNCTDCHGNDDPNSPRGPHGSSVPFLLLADYTTADGSEESESTYALCYRCHRRQDVLESISFPEHGEHIVEFKASCATCHSGHGSVDNRSLIRFGEETTIGGVSRSVSTDRLEFVSDGPGSGACFLTCHDDDHGPRAYGSMKVLLEERGVFGLDSAPIGVPLGVPRHPSRRVLPGGDVKQPEAREPQIPP